MRKCIDCPADTGGPARCPPCAARHREYMREYHQRPHVKVRHREYMREKKHRDPRYGKPYYADA